MEVVLRNLLVWIYPKFINIAFAKMIRFENLLQSNQAAKPESELLWSISRDAILESVNMILGESFVAEKRKPR